MRKPLHKYIHIRIFRTSRKQWPSHARRHEDKALLRNHRCFCSCLYNFKFTIKTSTGARGRLTSDWLQLSLSADYVTWYRADGAGRGEVNTCAVPGVGGGVIITWVVAVLYLLYGGAVSCQLFRAFFIHLALALASSLTVSAGSGTIPSPELCW